MIDREIAENPMTYPSPEIREKLYSLTPHQMGTQRRLARLWQRVLTGS